MARGQTDTVKTRVLIISDTHGADIDERDGQRIRPFPPFASPLPKADVLIHCGDLTMTGSIAQYHDTIDMLEAIDAPIKLVIAGNHDLSLDRHYTTTHLDEDDTLESANRLADRARNLWTAEDGRARNAGIMLLDEGYHQIALRNGATMSLYASPYTPEFMDWAFPYNHHEDRFNPPLASLSDARNIARYPVPSNDSNSPIDVMITHGPPFEIRDETDRKSPAGCPHLLRAAMRARPLLHCFGHIHEGHGADIVNWSTKAASVSTASYTIRDWKQGAWRTGVSDIVHQTDDMDTAPENRGIILNCTQNGGKRVKRGEQTLMVNASIMGEPTSKAVNFVNFVDDLGRCQIFA